MIAHLIEMDKRNVTTYDKRLGIVQNGQDNKYPTRMERLINGSITAKQCSLVYSKFIRGSGFVADVAEVTIGKIQNRKVTPTKLLKAVSRELSYFRGVFLHINYNLAGEMTSIRPIPFKHCRFGREDSDEYSGKILIYDNWDLEKSSRVRKSDIRVVDSYNPDPSAVHRQIESAGGIKNYNGQVFFHFMDENMKYPLAPIDVCISDAYSEYLIGLFKQGILDNDFITDKHIIRHPKMEDEAALKKFKDALKATKGAKNAGNHLTLEDRFTEGTPNGHFAIDTMKTGLNDKLFESWEQSVSNNIRKCFNNIPPVLVDFVEGKLGNTSGESFRFAQSFYNSQTLEERQEVTVIFEELFPHFHVDVNPSGNWEIEPLMLLSVDGTEVSGPSGNAVDVSRSVDADEEVETAAPVSEEERLNREAQATLRGSVGGVTAVLSIQQSVGSKTTTYDSGIAMLEEIFGYPTDTAERILGEPIETEPEGEQIEAA